MRACRPHQSDRRVNATRKVHGLRCDEHHLAETSNKASRSKSSTQTHVCQAVEQTRLYEDDQDLLDLCSPTVLTQLIRDESPVSPNENSG